MSVKRDIRAALNRIVDVLERIAPPRDAALDLSGAAAFVWEASEGRLRPVNRISGPALDLLTGVEAQKPVLLQNTERFAAGAPANNALLWGARGTGKSALVKAIFRDVDASHPGVLKLIETHRDEIDALPGLLRRLAAAPYRCILFCDDLSFEATDASYKALKAALEGGLEGRPENVVFYATSNRKHMTPRAMAENDDPAAIRRGESGQESTSLADRFGISLGFYPTTQDEYLAIVRRYAQAFALRVERRELEAEALAWAAGRGARSGRVAWQFIIGLAGRLGQPIQG
ncbi:MAG: ATP-binding protein [Pseudomonadota bacterium]